MKVQTSWEYLKPIPFLVIKKIKKQVISICNFLLIPKQCVADASNPFFKIFTHLLCCSVSYKEYHNPLVRVNKMVKNQCKLPPQSFRINLKNISYPYRLFSALSFSNIFVEFYAKPVYPTMFWNHFQICGVQIDEKYIVSQKN